MKKPHSSKLIKDYIKDDGKLFEPIKEGPIDIIKRDLDERFIGDADDINLDDKENEFQ